MLTIKFEVNNTSGYRYVLGNVLNQVLLHQSVIGLETKTAMDKYGIVLDIIIGCAEAATSSWWPMRSSITARWATTSPPMRTFWRA